MTTNIDIYTARISDEKKKLRERKRTEKSTRVISFSSFSSSSSTIYTLSSRILTLSERKKKRAPLLLHIYSKHSVRGT
jgi:hypothetical protein